VTNTQLEIMDYVKDNAAYIELGVAGVGHEWWVDSVKTRSEWYDLNNKATRSESQLRDHMEVIKNILWQYGISKDKGHSFPESFSALGFHWNPAGPFSTGKLFSDYGVKHVTTKFYIIPELNPPPEKSGGFDHDVLVLDRQGYGNVWNHYASLPDADISLYETDLIESHWANWLAEDDFLQENLNQKWIDYFAAIQAWPYRYLAKNSEQLYSQWLYKEYATVELITANSARIDNSNMPVEVIGSGTPRNMVLSLPVNENQFLESATLNGMPIPSYLHESGYIYVYLPPLSNEIYLFEWNIGSGKMEKVIHNTGTYNVYSVKHDDEISEFEIQMYGTQDVRFRVSNAADYDVASLTDGLQILDRTLDTTTGELVVCVRGNDIQGETGTLQLLKIK